MQPKKILIIDDEEELVFLTTKILKNAGHEVSAHSHITGALQKIQQVKPHLILLDIRLPDGSGLDFFEELQSGAKTKSIPIVFFSATAKTENSRLVDLKPAGLISKPYEIATLLGMVDGILSDAKGSER